MKIQLRQQHNNRQHTYEHAPAQTQSNQLDKQQAIEKNHRQQHNIGPATKMGKKSLGV
jgi:hypothetical protein